MKVNKRHLLKSVSWRVVGTLDTFFFAWLITGSIELGVDISLITTISKIIWYYLHERGWYKLNMKESNRKDILKTFSWRFVGSVDTALFSWIITGSPVAGIKISGFETVTKMILYFFHEKIWHKIKYNPEISEKV